MAHMQLPYRAEYFNSDKRAKCKDCKVAFEKEELRLAIVKPVSLFNEETYSWYHFACFFNSLHSPECVGDIDYFESLQWADQKKIKDEIARSSSVHAAIISNLAKKDKSAGASSSGTKDGNAGIKKKFCVQYSISSRAKCRKCETTIDKDAIRVGKVHGGEVLWYHLDCFAQVRDDLKFNIPVEELIAFELLADADQKTVKRTLVETVRKTKLSPAEICDKVKSALPKIELDEEQLALKKIQNEQMYEYRRQLSQLSDAALNKLMRENGLEFSGREAILDGLADAMTFGVLQRCENCKNGVPEFRLGLSGMSYYCPDEDEWTSCASYFDKPARSLFIVPQNMKRGSRKPEKSFLKTYEAKIEDRIFERNAPSASTIAANKGMVLRKTKRATTKTESTSVKLLVENGAAVHPQCHNKEMKRVYRDKDNIYSAVLLHTDLKAGKNSYCNIQILESFDPKYSLFQAWGEIGVPGLQKEIRTYGVENAIYQFESIFQRETHNAWRERHHFKKKPGKKVMLDLSYSPDTSSGVNQKDEEGNSCLDRRVQDLVKLIFDRGVMRTTAKKMELDLNKMPLGKLSKVQIQDAYEVLTQLQNYLSDENPIDPRIVMARSNKFYSLIPHNFAITDSPVLDSIPVIQKKFEMLDSLLEIEVACSLMLSADASESQKAVVDSYYETLKTEIRVLEETEPEFAILKRAAQNTHADTHGYFRLEIIRIFKVEREGEDKRYEPYKLASNRKLLWHGSRSTNFAGILSRGLQIAPRRVPTSGRMFGQGIYFADMVSKAANYCFASCRNNNHLLILSEVALGKMQYLFEANNGLQKPPPGFDSVKGVGRVEPDPTDTIEFYPGVTLASGAGVPSSANEEFSESNYRLNYNEYIVYDEARVNIKYLFQVKFKFTYC